MVAGSVYLVVTRAHDALRSEARIDSLLSREAMFLANNVVFVAIAFVVFLGTFYPLITEALGEKRALGPPWFDDYIVPFVLVLVLLSGIGAGDRVAPFDALAAVAQPAHPGDRRGRRAGARAAARRRRLEPAVARDVRRRHVRDRRRPPGAVARDARTPGDDRGGAARGARRRRAPQPPALRRLHRAHRDRRAVHRRRRLVGLQARARRPPAPGRDRARRRLRLHLRAPDGADRAARRRARADRARLARARGEERQDASRCCGPSAATTRSTRR